MNSQGTSRRPARPHCVSLAGALFLTAASLAIVACGDGASAPEQGPTPTHTATLIRPPATPTPEPATADQGEDEVESKCPDPYPEGAPYEPEPGEDIRLQPTGSPPSLDPYQPLPFAEDKELKRVVKESLGEESERFAVVVKNLADGRGAAVEPKRPFYAASLFKLWVMLEAYHQEDAGILDFGERYVVSDYYAREFGLNAGEAALCEEIPASDAVAAMIKYSDNVAANMLLDRVGSGNVNAALDGMGLVDSEIPVDGSLPTTAADLALLLEALARGQAVSAGASDEMIALLLGQAIGDRLPAQLPPEASVAHKTGNWTNATHDAGIVFSPGASYVIVVLTDYGFEEDGITPIAGLSRAVYDYYNGE